MTEWARADPDHGQRRIRAIAGSACSRGSLTGPFSSRLRRRGAARPTRGGLVRSARQSRCGGGGQSHHRAGPQPPPEEYRSVILIHDVEGLPNEEGAAVAGFTASPSSPECITRGSSFGRGSPPLSRAGSQPPDYQ